MAGESWPESLRALRRRAAAELRELDRERERLRALIAFADAETGAQRAAVPKKRRTRPAEASILEIVRDRPGIRASMLASLTDRSFEDVSADLAEREAAGRVRRRGLGWEAVDS